MVGRTGAGKTTLFSAILRLTELDSGQILIDDIDVSKVELNNLRSNVAVIPQDPVLFQVSFFFQKKLILGLHLYTGTGNVKLFIFSGHNSIQSRSV